MGAILTVIPLYNFIINKRKNKMPSAVISKEISGYYKDLSEQENPFA